MRKSVHTIGNLFWHAKHSVVHMTIGAIWYLYADYRFGGLPSSYLFIAIFSSVLPDLEHLYYLFISKNRHSDYTAQIKALLKKRQIISLFKLVEHNHKTQTFLLFHHIGVAFVFMLLAIWALVKQHEFLTIFYGGILSHYAFDIFDDFLVLKKLNPNWTRGLRKALQLLWLKRVTENGSSEQR